MINGNRPVCRRRLTSRSRSCRFSTPTWRIPERNPVARPRAAAAVVVAALSSNAATATLEALLQWACSGWSGPERDNGDDSTHVGLSSAAVAAATLFPATTSEARTSTVRRGEDLILRVTAQDLGPGRGRGLVAAADLAPGETLLSVPLTHVFTSQPDSELHWSAEMAIRLLRVRHCAAAKATDEEDEGEQDEGEEGKMVASASAGRQGSSNGSGTETLSEVDWGPWIAALPAAIRTPLEYDEEEIRQLRCPYVMEEVRVMQECVQDCYDVLQSELAELGCGWGDFLWAVQVFHSRCFYEPASRMHMCVPGVDLANHSPQPSAEVRLQHSPGACQGYDALAEVAEPPTREPSRFNLVVGEGGIRRGEEVTISYGRWPSEAFLLLFGFVPASPRPADGDSASSDISPGDCLTLFRDAEEAVQWCLQAASTAMVAHEEEQLQASSNAQGEAFTVVLRDIGEAMPEEPLYNLTVTPEGVDERLQRVLEVASRHLNVGPRDLLRGRLQERLSQFENREGISSDEAIGLFVRSKRALAQSVWTQV